MYGYIWAGTYGYGVFRINPKSFDFKHINSSNGLSNDNVINITGKNKIIWFSTLGGGATRYNLDKPDEFTVFNLDNGLASNYVYSVYVGSNDRTWISTDGGGLAYIENESVKSFSELFNTFSNKIVYSTIEDGRGNIWINSPDNGIYKYDGENIYNYNEINGLRTNSIQSLSADEYGNIIMVSNEGIDLYNISDSIFEYYGEDDGVAYLEPNLNALYKDSLNNVWIGTANGVIIYHSSRELCGTVQPKIFITKKSVFFTEIEGNVNKFRYNKNHLSFYYTGLWFKASNSLVYRYKLEGYDIDWNAETKLRMVTYSNLPPGEYKFIVQLKYAGGNWFGSNDSEYAFKIKPPFWRTAWFIILSIIIIVTGVLTYIRVRLENLKRAKEILEEEVKKRTKEIMTQKEEIEAQRDEIEAQRNFVMEQKDQIEKQNEDIKASIHYASRIQNAVLPPEENFNTYLGEHFIFYRPKDIVSGDFYYLNKINDCIIVAAADSTGHGVPGAFMSMLGVTLINKIVGQMTNKISAGEILTVLREEVKKSLRQTGKEGEAKDGMDIALLVINDKTKKVTFAGAYNPLTIVRNKELIIYKADRMPIGIYLKEQEKFTNHSVEVKKGDMIYLASDGFQDQMGGDTKNKFMVKNLRDMFIKISNKSMSEQKEIIESAFDSWKGDLSQIDDVLIIGFRI